MNPNYNQTITIYNCLKASDNPAKQELWYRHELNNCFYKNVIGRVEKGSGLQMANLYTVRIPESMFFKPYALWRDLSDAERKKYFTLHTDDIVVIGSCNEVISGLTTNTAAQVLNRMKPDAFRITAISINTKIPVGKHYRIGG